MKFCSTCGPFHLWKKGPYPKHFRCSHGFSPADHRTKQGNHTSSQRSTVPEDNHLVADASQTLPLEETLDNLAVSNTSRMIIDLVSDVETEDLTETESDPKDTLSGVPISIPKESLVTPAINLRRTIPVFTQDPSSGTREAPVTSLGRFNMPAIGQMERRLVGGMENMESMDISAQRDVRIPAADVNLQHLRKEPMDQSTNEPHSPPHKKRKKRKSTDLTGSHIKKRHKRD